MPQVFEQSLFLFVLKNGFVGGLFLLLRFSAWIFQRKILFFSLYRASILGIRRPAENEGKNQTNIISHIFLGEGTVFPSPPLPPTWDMPPTRNYSRKSTQNSKESSTSTMPTWNSPSRLFETRATVKRSKTSNGFPCFFCPKRVAAIIYVLISQTSWILFVRLGGGGITKGEKSVYNPFSPRFQDQKNWFFIREIEGQKVDLFLFPFLQNKETKLSVSVISVSSHNSLNRLSGFRATFTNILGKYPNRK